MSGPSRCVWVSPARIRVLARCRDSRPRWIRGGEGGPRSSRAAASGTSPACHGSGKVVNRQGACGLRTVPRQGISRRCLAGVAGGVGLPLSAGLRCCAVCGGCRPSPAARGPQAQDCKTGWGAEMPGTPLNTAARSSASGIPQGGHTPRSGSVLALLTAASVCPLVLEKLLVFQQSLQSLHAVKQAGPGPGQVQIDLPTCCITLCWVKAGPQVFGGSFSLSFMHVGRSIWACTSPCQAGLTAWKSQHLCPTLCWVTAGLSGCSIEVLLVKLVIK